MTAADELGPIIGMGALEQAIRGRLMQPQVLGVYIDESCRQTYGIETRVLRPKDIVCATETRTKLLMPAMVVQAEGNGDTHRHADRTYSATYVVGIHCINTGGKEADCRRTSDVHAAAARSLLLQRLEGQAVGQARIARVVWDGDAMDARPPGKSTAYADAVVQLTVTVSGLASDRRGRLPTLPPNEPGTGGPAPGPGTPPVVVDLPIEVEDPQP